MGAEHSADAPWLRTLDSGKMRIATDAVDPIGGAFARAGSLPGGVRTRRPYAMTTRFAGFEHRELHGCPVLFLRDARFKTFRVVFGLQRPLDDRMAARALLPALMQHGTAAHPDRTALARARERLYGAWTGPSVGKHTETALLRLQAEAVGGAFLPGRPDQFGASLDLLAECVLRPRAAAPGFPADLFAREQAQALAAARSVFDDKGSWARQQAVQRACHGEPYAILEHGGEAAIERATATDAAAMLQDFLAHGRRFCVAMGALPDDVPAAVERLLQQLPAPTPEPLPPVAVPAPRAVVRVRQAAAMQQAKVVLVLRVPIPQSVAEHCALQAALSLWGGGSHSRLFQVVREQQSLCYYASAGGDPRKGLVLVQSGCEGKHVDAVVAASLQQLDELRAGRFGDAELTTTLATITGSLLAIDDSLASRLQFTAEQWLAGHDQDPTARVQSYRAVTRDAVLAALHSLWVDHDYALVPTEVMA